MNSEDSIIVLDDDDEDEVTLDKTNKNNAKITTKSSGFRFPSEVCGYTRPSYSFSQLVTQALATCQNRTATACQICDLIAQKQPYYKYYPGDWRKHVYLALTKRNKFFVIVGRNSNNELTWSFNPTFEKYMLNKWVPKYLKKKSGLDSPSNAGPVLTTPSSESSGNSPVGGPVIVSSRSLRAEEACEMQAEFSLNNPKQVLEPNIKCVILADTSNAANPWEPEVTVSESAPSTVTSQKRKEQNLTITNFESHQISSEEVVYRLSFHKAHSNIQKFRLHCTVCDCHLGSAGSQLKSGMGVHPQLGVLICSLCSNGTYQGQADVCTWCCKLDGVFFLCSTCPSKFCEACIKRNFGNAWCSKLAGRRDWKCFLCMTKQIWPHRAITYFLFRHLKKLMRKKTELEKAVLTKDPLYPKNVDLTFFDTDFSECCKQQSHKEGPSELTSDMLSPSPPESVYAIPLPVLQPEPSSHNIFVNQVPWLTVNTGTQYIHNMYSGPPESVAASAPPRVPANTLSPQTFTNSMVSTSGPLPMGNPILKGMLNSYRSTGHVFLGENQSNPNFPSNKNFTSSLRCHTSDPTACPKTSVEMPIRLHNSTSSYAPPTTIPCRESVQLSTSQDLPSAKHNSDLPYSYYNLSSTDFDQAMKSSLHISSTSHVTANTAIQSTAHDSVLNSETNDDPEVKVIVDGGCLIKKSKDSFNTGIPSPSTNTVISRDVSMTNIGIRPRSFLINEGNSSKAAVTEEATEQDCGEVMPAPDLSLRDRINNRPMPKSKKQSLLRTVLMNESIESMKRHLQNLQPTISGTDSSNPESISDEAFIKNNANTTVLSNPQAAKTCETGLEEPILQSIIETATKALCLLDFNKNINSAQSTSVAKTTDSRELNEICEPHQPTSAPRSEIPKIKIRTLKELQEPSRLADTLQNDSKEVNKVKDNIINTVPDGICINVEVPEKEINVTSLKRGIIEASRTLIHTQKKFKDLAKVISCNLSYKPDQAVELVNKFQEILKTCRKQIDVIDTNITKEFGSLLPCCSSDSVLTSNNNNNNTPSNSCDENHFDLTTKLNQKIKKRLRSKIHPCHKPLMVPNVDEAVAPTLLEEPSQSSGWDYIKKGDHLQSFSTGKRKQDFLNFHQDHKRIFVSTSNKPEEEKRSSESSPASDIDCDPNEDLKQQYLLKRQMLCKKYKRKRNIWAGKRKYRPPKKVGDVVYNVDGSIRKQIGRPPKNQIGRPPKSLNQNQLHQKPKPILFEQRRLSGRQHPSSAALGIDPVVITCYLPPRCEIRPCSVMLHKLNERFVQLLTRTIRP